MRKKIIKAMAQGDKKAFIIIYKKYANLIANYMNSIILSKEDVKKVTCDFFVNLPNMTQNRYFDEKIKEKFKTWILILAREQALDYMNNPIS